MNFASYTKLISDSVAKSGYDHFLPSLCVLSDSVELHILEIEPQLEGDKQSALDWASEFTATDRLLFCAYRAGDRQVEVVEISGTDVTNKTRIHVRPYGGGVTRDSSRAPGQRQTARVPGAGRRNAGFIPRPRAAANRAGTRGRTA